MTVICPSGNPNFAVLQAGGLEVLDWDITGNVNLPLIRRLRALLEERQFHIVHAFNSPAVSNGLLAVRGMPSKFIAYRGIVGNVSFLDPMSWLRFLNPRIDRVVCVCDAIRDYFLRMRPARWRGPDSKYVRIYKGHSLDWYQSEPADLQQFGIPPGAFVVGVVANLRPRKGIDDLVAATLLFPPSVEIHILLIGHMDDPRLRRQIAASPHGDRVHFAGYRSDAPAVIAACNVKCLPSKKREGLPRSVIEAMAYGVAPVVTDSGGSPELVVDGESGIVVRSSDPESLAAGILKLYNDRELCARIGAAARERIAQHFRIEDTIQQTYELYSELVAE
jgi:glycosyltransferase involved in cell wall biosynthesis